MVHRFACPLPPVSPAEVAAHDVVATLRASGFEAYIVGGAVRDRLLGRPAHDVDVATNATPQQVQRCFPRTIPVGAAFGVIIVLTDTIHTEVATFRAELGYHDGRRPDQVVYATAAEDVQRRDFTINALFYDPATSEVLDHADGLADLRRGVIRAIGEPAQRFAEDHLRLLRAVRFAARFDFALEPATAAAVAAHAGDIVRISAERILQELTKLLTGPRPDRAFALLDGTGLLAHVLPEIAACKGVAQPAQFHPEGDVWAHLLLILRTMVHPCPALAWGCLLHDVGKPPTFTLRPDGREAFPCHAEIGAPMAAAILRRLHASTELVDTVSALVLHHMTFKDVQRMRPATLRRLLARPTFALELELHRIDCSASNGMLDNYVFLLDQLHALANQPQLPPPLLNGRDVLAAGLRPGPLVGELLREAQDMQLAGTLTTRDEALAWLAAQLTAPPPPPAHG
jgi:poly(A) polymerase